MQSGIENHWVKAYFALRWLLSLVILIDKFKSFVSWLVCVLLSFPLLFQRCFSSYLALITRSGPPAKPLFLPPYPPGDGMVHSYEASSFTSLSHRLGLVQWERQIRVFIIWLLSRDSPHSIYSSLSLSLSDSKGFLNRETVQLMAMASFCLLFWFPTPFISFPPPKQSQQEGMGGL